MPSPGRDQPNRPAKPEQCEKSSRRPVEINRSAAHETICETTRPPARARKAGVLRRMIALHRARVGALERWHLLRGRLVLPRAGRPPAGARKPGCHCCPRGIPRARRLPARARLACRRRRVRCVRCGFASSLLDARRVACRGVCFCEISKSVQIGGSECSLTLFRRLRRRPGPERGHWWPREGKTGSADRFWAGNGLLYCA